MRVKPKVSPLKEKETSKHENRMPGGSETGPDTATDGKVPQPTANVKNERAPETPPSPDVFDPHMALSLIADAPDNPRRSVGDVSELAESIREHELLHPLVVTPRGDGYVLVAGHRRKAALLALGRLTGPVIIRVMGEVLRKTAMLVENCQRADLTVGEEASSFRALEELGLTQREIAQKTGRSQAHVSKRLSLLGVPEVVLLVEGGKLDIQVAMDVVKLEGKARTQALAWARSGSLNSWQVSNLKRQAEHEAAIATKKAEAKAAGWKVLGVTSSVGRAKHWRLGQGWGELDIEPMMHASLPCHAVLVEWDGSKLVPCCTDRTQHPEVKTKGEAQEGAAERKAKEAKEAAAREASKRSRLNAVTRASLGLSEREILELSGRLILNLIQGDVEVIDKALDLKQLKTPAGKAHAEQRELEEDGVWEELEKRLKGSPPFKARSAVFALIASHIEACLNRDWHGFSEADAAYLSLLQRHGHKLSKAEQQKMKKISKTKTSRSG